MDPDPAFSFPLPEILIFFFYIYEMVKKWCTGKNSTACTGTSGVLPKSINLMYRYWDLPSYLCSYKVFDIFFMFLNFFKIPGSVFRIWIHKAGAGYSNPVFRVPDVKLVLFKTIKYLFGNLPELFCTTRVVLL